MAGCTLVVRGTGIPIVAGQVVVVVKTSAVGGTTVCGAGIAVIAVYRSARAPTLLAGIFFGAEITVITLGLVVDERTAQGLFAGIVGAGIVVGTWQRIGADALAEMAMVPGCAQVVIIATCLVHGVNASREIMAGIVRARICVCAVDDTGG